MIVVVTGAAGFVGRALIDLILQDGHSVVALDMHAAAMTHPLLRVVAGDLGNIAVRRTALADGCDALVHLATVPGGAAEGAPAESRRINIDAMYDLLEETRAVATQPARFVFASSIAVLGDPLPAGGVDDRTPVAPRLIYGGHKAMMEIAVSMMSARGEIDGVTVRLPGIIARPKGPSGMKSAFMSDLFHAALAAEPFVCPISSDATLWLESISCVASNLRHALSLESTRLPATRVVTLPALRVTMKDLIAEVAAQTGASPGLVSFRPDPGLEAAFGSHPALSTPAAYSVGFHNDGDLTTLVARALRHIGEFG